MRHGSQGAQEGDGGGEGASGGIANGPRELVGGIAGIKITMSDIASPEKSILKTLASSPSHQTSPVPFSLQNLSRVPATGMWRLISAVHLSIRAEVAASQALTRLPSTQVGPEPSRESVAMVEVELPSVDLSKVLTPALAWFPCVVERPSIPSQHSHSRLQTVSWGTESGRFPAVSPGSFGCPALPRSGWPTILNLTGVAVQLGYFGGEKDSGFATPVGPNRLRQN